jgi:hypothetical protein
MPATAEHPAKARIVDGLIWTARAIAHGYSLFATGGRELGLCPTTLELLATPAIPLTREFDDGCLKPETRVRWRSETISTPRSRSHETGLTKRTSRSARPAILILLLPFAILAVLVRPCRHGERRIQRKTRARVGSEQFLFSRCGQRDVCGSIHPDLMAYFPHQRKLAW